MAATLGRRKGRDAEAVHEKNAWQARECRYSSIGSVGMCKIAIAFTVLLFAFEMPMAFLSPGAGEVYGSVQIFLIGLAAMAFQRLFASRPVADMGFRIGRGTAVSITIAIVFVLLNLCLLVGLPLLVGWAQIFPNKASALQQASGVAVLLGLTIALPLLLISCLLGEELAFRGFLLPRLNECFGPVKAVVLTSAVFGLWHLPDYWSIYAGGARGCGSTLVAVLLHAVSSAPICILYLATRDLYGVSLYHATLGLVQYAVLGNPTLGQASAGAMYEFRELNGPALEILGWVWTFLAIPTMLLLCAVSRRTGRFALGQHSDQ